jgi:hypothetical protein
MGLLLIVLSKLKVVVDLSGEACSCAGSENDHG